jgi:hypothetical protein
VGEPGLGKTVMGSALAVALRTHMKPDQVVIIMSPPHLTGKWQREIEMVGKSVGVRVHAKVLKTVDDTRAFMDADLPLTLKIGIIPGKWRGKAGNRRYSGASRTTRWAGKQTGKSTGEISTTKCRSAQTATRRHSHRGGRCR